MTTPLTVYSFERSEDDFGYVPFGSFTTMDYREACEYGMKNGLRVIANSYEWAESELVEDFS